MKLAAIAVAASGFGWSPANAFVPSVAPRLVHSQLSSARNVQAVSGRAAARCPVGRSICAPVLPAAREAVVPRMAVATAGDSAQQEGSGLAGQLKVASYFGLWYLFNIGYNIYNKRALNALPLPWLTASAQLGVGILYVMPLWLSRLRAAPKLADGALKPLSKLAFLHMCAHITAVLSLGAGAVSFTHIVKAAEPVFTAGLSIPLLGQVFALPVYLSLIPVILGVSLASLKELSFSWVAFGNAMGSNTASALRGILSKKQMGEPVGENMNAANLYAVLTILAFCFLTPAALLIEGAKLLPAWDSALAAGSTAKGLATTIGLSGIFYYLYNEVAFLALNSVNAVTHAVGNTIKRVVIIVSACIAFRTPMTPLAITGSTIAILGTLLYSLVKQKYDKK